MPPTQSFLNDFQSFIQGDTYGTPTQSTRSDMTASTTYTTYTTASGGDDRDIGSSVLLFLVVGVAGVAVLSIFVGLMVDCCCKGSRWSRHRNSSSTSPQIRQTSVETQNKWYHCRKTSSPRSSPRGSPEDVALELVMSSTQRRTSASQSENQTRRPNFASAIGLSIPEDQPPEYQTPTQPPSAYLNPANSASNMTLPAYERRHQDQIYDWEELDSIAAPAYSQNWIPWSPLADEHNDRRSRLNVE